MRFWNGGYGSIVFIFTSRLLFGMDCERKRDYSRRRWYSSTETTSFGGVSSFRSIFLKLPRCVGAGYWVTLSIDSPDIVIFEDADSDSRA
jgi:hypothetical protein